MGGCGRHAGGFPQYFLPTTLSASETVSHHDGPTCANRIDSQDEYELMDWNRLRKPDSTKNIHRVLYRLVMSEAECEAAARKWRREHPVEPGDIPTKR
jgi:hypothetical protein